MKSPLPTPKIFTEKSFSSKKERRGYRIEKPPPTPRVKLSNTSCSSARGFFSHSSNNSDCAQSISFRDSRSSLSSKYDSTSDLLYFHQCFKIICKIGSGSFGDVFKVKCIEDDNFYAVKRAKQKFAGRADRERKLQEVQKHEQLPYHPNCVRFFAAWEEQLILYIQIELCKYSLSQYADENHNIPESIVRNFLIDLLLAVEHLHDHNLVHLDIKPDNIFISKHNICKLGDFGLILDLSKSDTSDAIEGDPRYIAPELMRGVFTKAADIFSLGITILELASDLDLPRGGDTWHQLRNLEIPKAFTEGISYQLFGVISQMMEPDPNTRPTVRDILNIDTVDTVCKKRKRMITSSETLINRLSAQKLENQSIFSDLNSSFSDEVFEKSSSDSYYSLNNSSTDKRLFLEEKVALNTSLNFNNSLNDSFDSSRRPLHGMSTPCTRRFLNSRCATSASPCLSGGKKKELLLDDDSPLFQKSPCLKLFSGNSSDEDEELIANLPPKNLLNVFDALSPSQ